MLVNTIWVKILDRFLGLETYFKSESLESSLRRRFLCCVYDRAPFVKEKQNVLLVKRSSTASHIHKITAVPKLKLKKEKDVSLKHKGVRFVKMRIVIAQSDAS